MEFHGKNLEQNAGIQCSPAILAETIRDDLCHFIAPRDTKPYHAFAGKFPNDLSVGDHRHQTSSFNRLKRKYYRGTLVDHTVSCEYARNKFSEQVSIHFPEH